MAENKKRQKNKPNIQLSAGSLVCRETTIHLSDVKLKTSLSNIYEKAAKDSKKNSFWTFFQVPLSMSGTLFLTSLTSEFKGFWSFSGEEVGKFFSFLAIFLFIFGLYMFTKYLSIKYEDTTELRDKAVEMEIKNIMFESEDPYAETEVIQECIEEEKSLAPV